MRGAPAGAPGPLAKAARSYFRAVAVDFDGTLTGGGPPAAEVLDAVARARSAGTRVVLVTGRILAELEEVFPRAGDHFDAVVAENGAVLARAGHVRRLADPVDPQLLAELKGAGVAVRPGEVLVAGAADDDDAVLAAVRRLGLECQLVLNRGELMVLPSGTTKGTGVREALSDLGLSPHNAIAVGDAENDHSLFDAAEVAVAVADAVPALRSHADVVLDRPDGEGVISLLEGDLVAGTAHHHSRRWQLELGRDDRGEPVKLPASQLNLLVAGGSGDGKSYMAGLVAEQLVSLRYSALIVDPEGDHVGLDRQRGAVALGGDADLPRPEAVVNLLAHGWLTVVVDLSTVAAEAVDQYVRSLVSEVEAQRTLTGSPQWLILEEAQTSLARDCATRPIFEPATKGHCLVTWKPELLSSEVLASTDAVLAMTSADPSGPLVEATAAVADLARAPVAEALAGGPGRAVLARRDHPGRLQVFTPAARHTPHLRHEHKYGTRGVEPERRFYFARGPWTTTGVVAANLSDLESELDRCEQEVLRHHCPPHDFSRWVEEVLQEHRLGGRLSEIEAGVAPGSPAAVVEAARVQLIAAIRRRRAP